MCNYLYPIWKNRHISKFKFFVFLFVYVSAVIVSQSRAIFISTSLCILAQSLFLLRINPKYIVVISAFFVWLYIEHLIAVWELIISIKSSNFDSRMNQISIGVRIFSENIFFGGGYSEYFKYTDKHVLHNMVVTILSSNGLLGIILFFIINITIVLVHLRSKEFVQILVCFFAIHLVLNASSGLSFYSFWLFIGVAYAFPPNRIGSLNG